MLCALAAPASRGSPGLRQQQRPSPHASRLPIPSCRAGLSAGSDVTPLSSSCRTRKFSSETTHGCMCAHTTARGAQMFHFHSASPREKASVMTVHTADTLPSRPGAAELNQHQRRDTSQKVPVMQTQHMQARNAPRDVAQLIPPFIHTAPAATAQVSSLPEMNNHNNKQ